MLAKVEIIFGLRRSRRGFSSHERYVFDFATVTEASPCYYWIEGEAIIYKGKKSSIIKNYKKQVRLRVVKTKSDLKIEKLSNAAHFINDIE